MHLRLEILGGIAHLVIDRALKRNALTTAMFEALPALVAEAESKRHVRAIVLRSARPGLFSAGADLAEFSANARDAAWRTRNQAAINAAQARLAHADRPVVAFIDGDCMGAGCGLTLSCDIRIATPRARFGMPPARLGLVYPFEDTRRLVSLIGPGQAKRLLFTADMIAADEALRIGLVDIVADQPDEMLHAIAAASPYSTREAKTFVGRILDGQTEDDAETLAMFDRAFDGDDFREGVNAFLEKRTPDFK